MNTIERLQDEMIIPVIKLEDSGKAVPLCDALRSGGVEVAEITFRTPAAAAAIAVLRKERPEMVVGAGTVLTLEQLEAAERAGASFIVTPGFNPEIVKAAQKKGLPIVPGVNNPSQVEQAMHCGLEVLKFFPASISGGIPMLKAFATVYTARFMPTGGLDAENFIDYLALPNVLACGGSWMVKPSLITDGAFDTIATLCREAKKKIKDEI